MGDVQSAIVKYRFGQRFRNLLLIVALVLVLSHLIVLLLPFLDLMNRGDIEHTRHISDNISGITVAVILIILVIEGQRSVRSAIMAQRRDDYKDIGDQITKWLERSGSEAFVPSVVDSTIEEREILRNFMVCWKCFKNC